MNMNKQTRTFKTEQELQTYLEEALKQKQRQQWRTQKQQYRQRKKQQKVTTQ